VVASGKRKEAAADNSLSSYRREKPSCTGSKRHTNKQAPQQHKMAAFSIVQVAESKQHAASTPANSWYP
jgi:hypothetical protein